MSDEVPIKEMARGHWSYLLPRLGVPVEALNRKHGPCPICKGGTDRYRWDDQNSTGGYICSSCGAGDGFMLAAGVTGKSFGVLAKEVRGLLRDAPPPSQTTGRATTPDRHALNRVWRGSTAPERGGVVATYLSTRLGRFWPSQAIRQHPSLHHPDADRAYPAMVAMVSGPNGQAASLHMTYLDPAGASKAPVEPARRLAAGKIPDGSAVRLWPARPVMGVAEGIETAMSAAIIYKMPVWACLSAAMLAKWEPPAEAQEIAIFSDNDRSYAGQAAGYRLAQRVVASGRKTTVFVPDAPGTDFNDVLLAQKS